MTRRHTGATTGMLTGWLALAIPAAGAEGPQLTYLQVDPAHTGAGGQITLTVTATQAQGFDAVYFRQPNGAEGRLDPGETAEQGSGTYTATFTVPPGSPAGTWRVAEVGVIGADNAPYRFLATDLFPSAVACPQFENIGILACGSAVVRDGGAFVIE